MPHSVNFKVELSSADIARLVAARNLFDDINDGKQPQTLPSELVGHIESVEEFVEIFYDQYGSIAEFEVSDASVYFDDDDVEIHSLADLLTLCCRDSLPISYSWHGRDGSNSGSVAVFAGDDYWLNEEAAEQHLLELGRREVAARTEAQG